MYSRHRLLLLILPLSVAIVLRLYPYFLSGVPWGTDAWPLIRNANELLSHSPTSLGGNPIFDSYNIYWPGASLFGAQASLLLGASPLQVMPIIIPLVASFTTLFFFLIVEKLTKSSLVASISSLFFATAGFDAIFTASATKETFAYPLFMLAVLLILDKINARNVGLFTLVSVTLALSHHVTMIVLLAIAAALAITNSMVSLSSFSQKTIKKVWVPPLIIAAIFIAYIEFYARDFLTGAVTGFPISPDVIIALGAIFALSVAFATNYCIAREMKSMVLEGFVLLGVSLGLLYWSTTTVILPFAPRLPELIALLALPYLVVAFFSILGYKELHMKDRQAFIFASSWLAATVALLGYTLIGNPNGVFLIYRLFTFVYAPLAIFAAVALVALLESQSKLKILKTAGVVVLVVGIALSSAFMSYSSVVGKQNLLGGHYAYTKSDLESGVFVNSTLSGNSTIAADNMIQNLYQGYFNLNVSATQGFDYLFEGGQLQANSSNLLVTYSLMSSQGYDLFLYGLPLPQNYTNSLERSYSLVFNNGNEMIWK